ncbi:putative lipase lipH [Mycobacterium kansasii]|uniref:Putative lipase lipH n=1 Tax=Mycobacterium kansasii TaxID=1768 RepID=A0A1V3WDH9_MYCKA|nr:putative lipase lipH [Mycobacterium kansasii]
MPSLDQTADERPALDPILLKVLDAVPFRLSTDDGIDAMRQRMRDLPRRPVYPELRIEDRSIDGPGGGIGIRIYWPPSDSAQGSARRWCCTSTAAASSWAISTPTTAPAVTMPWAPAR